MKEFYLALREHVGAGLRQIEEVRPGEPGLVLAENLRPVIGGLRSAYTPASPLEAEAWPFPQLFRTYQGLLLAGETSLHSYAAGAVAELLGDLAAGHEWSLIDFMAYLLATNGVTKIYRDPATASWGVNSDANIPDCGVLGDFNGQALAGDLTSSWQGAASNWVAWGNIGNISFVPDKKNIAGLRPMPWPGSVFAVKQLGKHVMVYGDNGVGFLVPASTPAPTFGFKELPFAGVAGRLAVCGDEDVHYFVDALGELWSITDNHAISSHGYKEFLAPLLAGGVSLSYNGQAGEVVISGSDRHFIYSSRSKSLAGPSWQPVSGTCFHAGSPVLVGPQAVAPTQALVVTNPVDMNRRSHKTLEWAGVVGRGLEDLEIAADYRFDSEAEWLRSPWIPAGPEGVARIGVTALEFRLCARCTLNEDLLLSQFNARWKATDKRFSRGSEAINWGQGQPGV